MCLLGKIWSFLCRGPSADPREQLRDGGDDFLLGVFPIELSRGLSLLPSDATVWQQHPPAVAHRRDRRLPALVRVAMTWPPAARGAALLTNPGRRGPLSRSTPIHPHARGTAIAPLSDVDISGSEDHGRQGIGHALREGRGKFEASRAEVLAAELGTMQQ